MRSRALKEYADPKTSPQRQAELETHFRETPITGAEEKRLLKGAALDLQLRAIASDLDMALMLAIRAHPEESDKKYILERMRMKAGVGWLLYVMLTVWDPRYVPHLLDGVGEGDVYSIAVLGYAKAKEARLTLEAALKHENPEVRKAAAAALKRITGKDYKYQE